MRRNICPSYRPSFRFLIVPEPFALRAAFRRRPVPSALGITPPHRSAGQGRHQGTACGGAPSVVRSSPGRRPDPRHCARPWRAVLGRGPVGQPSRAGTRRRCHRKGPQQGDARWSDDSRTPPQGRPRRPEHDAVAMDTPGDSVNLVSHLELEHILGLATVVSMIVADVYSSSIICAPWCRVSRRRGLCRCCRVLILSP